MGLGWHNDAMGSGWWVLTAVGMLVFLAVLAIGGVVLVRHYGQLSGNPGTRNPAIDFLHQRFARGEISEEEYTRDLALLKGES